MKHLKADFYLADCRQITIVKLIRFCMLSTPSPPTHLFLTGNIKMDGMPTEIKEKYPSFDFLHCI